MRLTRPALGLGSLALVLPLLFATCSDGNLVAPPMVPPVRDLPESLGYSISDSESVTAAGTVEFVSASSGHANSASTISLGRPSGLRQGDVMIAQIGTQGAARVNTPTGWTLVRGDYNGTHANSYVFWKRAGTSEPSSYSWTISASSRIAGGIVAYRNVLPDGNPIDAHGSRDNAASTNIVAPSITTTTEGAYLVGLFSAASEKNETNLSFTPPSGMAERYDLSSQAKGANQNVVVTHASAGLTTAGATGTRTARLSAARPGWGQLVALKPAASTTPPPSESPVANAGGPYSGSEGTQLRFDGRGSSDPNGESLTYQWVFGDGNTGTGQRPWHTYADNGTYTVVLVVTNASGLSSAPDTTTATIANVAPTVSLSLSSTSIQVGEAVSLTGTFSDPGANDAPWAWEIDWGEGTKQSGSTSDPSSPIAASHSYSAAGNYVVRMRVTDKEGDTGAAEQTLSVSGAADPSTWFTDFSEYTTGQKPSDWSYPYTVSNFRVEERTGSTGGKVLYNSISSTAYHVLRWDAVGTPADVELETVVRVASGSTHNESMALMARGQSGEQTFYSSRLDSGTGLWTLSKYRSGNSGTPLATWSNPFPVGTWVRHRFRVEGNTLRVKLWPADGTEPTSWTLEATDSSPLGSGFAGVWMRRNGAINEFDWVRVTSGSATSPPSPPSNQPPVAKAGGPYTGSEGAAVAFDASASSDPDGDPLSYSWSFGDWQIGSGVRPSHSYRDNGSYTVVLTVTDAHGASSQDSTTATIANVAPTVSLTLSTSSVQVGETLTLTGSFSDPGLDDDPWAIRIRWGDGTTINLNATDQSQPISGTHSYAAEGTYTADLRVTDKDGGQRTASQTVTVAGATSPPPSTTSARFTDFSTYAAGLRPNDWSNAYTSSGYVVQWEGGSLGMKLLHHSVAATANHVLRWDAAGSFGDVEVEAVARVTRDSKYNEGAGVVVRGSSTAATFYTTRLSSSTGQWHITRYAGGTATDLAGWSNPFPKGTWIRQRFRVEGNALRAKFWAAGEPEPATWTLEVSDPNQLPAGFVGVFSRRGSSSNEFEWFGVAPVSPANQPPAASFTVAADGLTAEFSDTSTDPDGAIVQWEWDFGDGTTALNRHPIHTYAASGSYQVRLRVMDNRGAVGTREQFVSVGGAGSSKVVLVGAGDIAGCGSDKFGHVYQDAATASLLDRFPSATVFTSGDNVYDRGTAKEFADCYDPSWGRHKHRTRPSAGNHEYDTSGAVPYYEYFGAAAGDPDKGYYSYTLGNWFIVALNSNVPLAAGSPQDTWLRAQLAANTKPCILAYWHHPRYSSGRGDNNHMNVTPFWEALYQYRTDLVVVSHDHLYERFAPKDPWGNLDLTRGIRQLSVGTGGARLYDFKSTSTHSQVRHNQTHGIVKLTLENDGYTWEFIPVAAKSFTDSGRERCR